MAGLTATGRNAAVDGVAAVTSHIALHDSSGTELTGGSPAYARKPITWTAAASGVRDNNAALVFDIPAAANVAFIGLWSALTVGTNHGILPVQGAAGKFPDLALAATTDIITSIAHGFVNTDRVITLAAAGAALPTGLNATTVYFVTGVTADTFTLSLTSGGASVDITTAGELFVVKTVVETYAAQGTYTIPINTLDLDANLI